MLKNYSKIKVDEYGNKRYFNDKGKLHRLDGPATEDSNGSKLWSINGIDHRNIDPCLEWFDGGKRCVIELATRLILLKNIGIFMMKNIQNKNISIKCGTYNIC